MKAWSAAFDCAHSNGIHIEGQGAISHMTSCTSDFILRGSQSDAGILQPGPKRARRCVEPPGEPLGAQGLVQSAVFVLAVAQENLFGHPALQGCVFGSLSYIERCQIC